MQRRGLRDPRVATGWLGSRSPGPIAINSARDFESRTETFLRSVMSYVNSVLQPGERVIMRGHLHWIVYWHAILFLVLGIVLVAWEPPGVWDGMLRPATAIAFGVPFVLSFAHARFI